MRLKNKVNRKSSANPKPQRRRTRLRGTQRAQVCNGCESPKIVVLQKVLQTNGTMRTWRRGACAHRLVLSGCYIPLDFQVIYAAGRSCGFLSPHARAGQTSPNPVVCLSDGTGRAYASLNRNHHYSVAGAAVRSHAARGGSGRHAGFCAPAPRDEERTSAPRRVDWRSALRALASCKNDPYGWIEKQKRNYWKTS
jgi:hypothetical protein